MAIILCMLSTAVAAARAGLAPTCTTVANTDLAVAGQGPDLHGCPSVAACCGYCTNKTDFFVFQESGQCYCKS